MSKNRCPECGSSNIQTERRLDGFHHCIDCRHRWKIGESQPKQTLFDRITQSPEMLAPKFIGLIFDHIFTSKYRYYSMLTGEFYNSESEAIATTVAKLKEVVG